MRPVCFKADTLPLMIPGVSLTGLTQLAVQKSPSDKLLLIFHDSIFPFSLAVFHLQAYTVAGWPSRRDIRHFRRRAPV
jgi:hypothetical protein